MGNDPLNNVDPFGDFAAVLQNGNNIVINVPVQFVGGTAAQQSAIVNAAQSQWSGQFGQYNVTTNIVSPIPYALGNINTITIQNQSGVSNTNAVDGNQSTVYTSYPQYPPYSISQFGNTGAQVTSWVRQTNIPLRL